MNINETLELKKKEKFININNEFIENDIVISRLLTCDKKKRKKKVELFTTGHLDCIWRGVRHVEWTIWHVVKRTQGGVKR